MEHLVFRVVPHNVLVYSTQPLQTNGQNGLQKKKLAKKKSVLVRGRRVCVRFILLRLQVGDMPSLLQFISRTTLFSTGCLKNSTLLISEVMGKKKAKKRRVQQKVPPSQSSRASSQATQTPAVTETEASSKLLNEVKQYLERHPPLPRNHVNAQQVNSRNFQNVVDLVRNSNDVLAISRAATSLDGTLYLVWQLGLTVTLVRYGQSPVHATYHSPSY